MLLLSPRPASPLSPDLLSVGSVGQVMLTTCPTADPETDTVFSDQSWKETTRRMEGKIHGCFQRCLRMIATFSLIIGNV